MLYIIKSIVNLILPPSCFIIALLIYAFLHYKRSKKIPKLIIITTLIMYIFSIPLTSDLLIHSLEYKFTPSNNLNGDVIVVLGGGATQTSPDVSGEGTLSSSGESRLLTAARIHNKTGLPIIFSGGQVFKENGVEAQIAKRQLLDLGFSKNDIIVEDQSLNTAENAKFTSVLLKKYRYTNPILVTSAFHMYRAKIHFNNCGVKNIKLFPCDYFTNKNISVSFNSFIPSYTRLTETCIALHEYLGVLQALVKR